MTISEQDNEFNQLRANIELTKKQITEAQVENT